MGKLPADKFDVEAVERLSELSDDELRPLIPELLTWIQDMNWPVAGPAAELLSERKELVEPFIPPLLRAEQKDEVWKYCLIRTLVKAWGNSASDCIKNEVMRIAASPTDTEKAEEVNEAAVIAADTYTK